MQEVLSDKIVPNPENASDGYRFRIAKYVQNPARVRVIELAGTSAAEELAIVNEVLSTATAEERVHVWGIRSAESVAAIRAHFDALGYYDAPRNRYDYDCRTVAATFGADLSALGYWPGVPPLGSAATKAVRSGLNLEILKWLRLADAPGTPGRRKKTPEEVLSELVFSWMFSPFRIGRALYFDMFDRGIADGHSELDVVPFVTG